MSNYRRLISYIYAYEGGVKGKNIGFAKLETRNGQCRIQVSVRKVFIGGQDMGVFLLSSGSEIFLGRIFLRNGAGEFRTSVAVDHVAGSEQNIDQCYGLTIHGMEDSWQNYTTIWEDAVAHAAEVELEEAVSELAEEQEMNQVPESAISGKKIEEVVTNHKSSIVENIEAEIQAQNQMQEKASSGQDMEEEMPSTYVQPRKEEPQKILWPKKDDAQTAEKAPDKGQPMGEKQPQLQQRFEEQHQEEQPENQPKRSPQEQLEKELSEEVLETPKEKSEEQKIQEREAQRDFGEQQREQAREQQQERQREQTQERQWEQTQEQQQERQPVSSVDATESQGGQQVWPQTQSQPQQRTQPQQRMQFQTQPRQQLFRGYFPRRPVHGILQQEQYYQKQPAFSMEAADMMSPIQRQAEQPMQQQPTSSIQQQPESPIQQQPTSPTQQQPESSIRQPASPIQQPTSPMQQSISPMQQPMSPMQQQAQPMRQPTNWERQPEGQEREETKEGTDIETLWQRFYKTYPKIQAFDYDGNCEILTIKPQDIGLLPREIWTYGNNSFLLHGYYNHRYLILARLTTPNGGIRFLLGVPGHYYSNEKYMASMFGFPNFVMSKTQPPNDNRFGYWYTDLRLGF